MENGVENGVENGEAGKREAENREVENGERIWKGTNVRFFKNCEIFPA